MTGVNNSLDIAEQVEVILSTRRPVSSRIGEVITALDRLTDALNGLATKQEALLGRADELEVASLRQIDIEGLVGRYRTATLDLQKLRARFSREFLSIGVVGRARQGKSRLLQSLSGLSAQEIPDGDRQHCTGVRSLIVNYPEAEAYAEVHFHTDQSFLSELIAPYYRTDELHLGPPPLSIEQFTADPLPPLPDQLASSASTQAKYEHLRRYKDHLEAYRHLLAHKAPLRVAPSQIRDYVAQDTVDGDRSLYNYMAVKEVRIACPFPYQGIGRLALVDTPGLGDTGVGDQSRLLATLGKEVDIVLFVRMPRARGDHWADVDVELYDVASEAIRELPLARWSFMVLNHVRAPSPGAGDNLNNCQDLLQTISEKHIDVTDAIIADCSDPSDVASKVLSPAVDYLTRRIGVLDFEYAQHNQTLLTALHQDTRALLDQAGRALGDAPYDAAEFRRFTELFNGVWDDLASGLEAVVHELEKSRNQPSSELSERLERILSSAGGTEELPGIEEIERRRDRMGSFASAYHSFLNELRTHLSRRFTTLEKALHLTVEEAKQRVVRVLREQGALAVPLARTPEGPEAKESAADRALSGIANSIPEDLRHLKDAFQTLTHFELTYRGFIQYRVRQQLDTLTPDHVPLQLKSNPTPQDVLDLLLTFYQETVYKLRTAFEDWMADPNRVAFAVVEEFADQVLRSKEAWDEWRNLYFLLRAEVWPEEFRALGVQSRLRQEWERDISEIAQLNQEHYFQFLHPQPTERVP